MAQRIVVVTGGHGVLGSAVVSAALKQGLTVAVIDHADHPCAPGVLGLSGIDLTDAEQARNALDAVAQRLGGVHALLNIAGGFAWQTTQDGDPATWGRMHALNVVTALNASRAALPHLKAASDGRIVNVGSAAALKAGAGMGPYGAAKSGVHALTQALAEELKPTGVTVNAVLPSIIDTPQNRTDMPDADPNAWVAPADLASVMLYLASPAARAVTGALLPVTGRV